MRRKKVIILILMMIYVFSLTACNKTRQAKMETSQRGSKKIEIGVIFDSFIIERWQRDRDAFVEKAQKDMEANVTIQNANGDVQEQERLIDSFIQKKVDVLVIVPIDCNAITEAVKRAKKSGIIVISYDRLIKNADVDLYISFDNEKVGALMAKTMEENLKEGSSIFMMCGPKEDNNVSLVGKGFSEEIKDSKLKIVEVQHATGWLAEDGYQYISEYLNAHKSIDGVMCGNDGIASQVIRALSERRLAGKVCVVGQDADLDACQRIVEGTQTMTVYKPVKQLADLAAESAIVLAKGERLNNKSTCYDGTYHVPYIGLDPVAITKSSMNLVIDDGFHDKEDIFLNIK